MEPTRLKPNPLMLADYEEALVEAQNEGLAIMPIDFFEMGWCAALGRLQTLTDQLQRNGERPQETSAETKQLEDRVAELELQIEEEGYGEDY